LAKEGSQTKPSVTKRQDVIRFKRFKRFKRVKERFKIKKRFLRF